ncbi:ACT domain-containing protein [Vibrio nitrifigilis]|uniref:ACT domain-containing protein n=1 Tax=Vibrio nitrifigilis TaxID=2789781 RepID=A0ABS0GCU5_9VIBR|nr:ACT domain-containing protein [Vibrio nitrifigilis]MBF9000232.1 ACT domain-containing protein [Vibrio nitrifigilis]
MSGITELETLLASMSPELSKAEWVFCSVTGNLEEYLSLKPIATFLEAEGLTLIIHKYSAINAGIEFDRTFRKITLNVHSSLEAVGLTAVVATKLTEVGVSANVIAAYFHDHIFVPSEQADKALSALQTLTHCQGVA